LTAAWAGNWHIVQLAIGRHLRLHGGLLPATLDPRIEVVRMDQCAAAKFERGRRVITGKHTLQRSQRYADPDGGGLFGQQKWR
jgi:hypothetical protein